MKRVLVLLVILYFGLFLMAFTNTRCPLTGNTYVFETDGIQYELSGFVCTFGPGCEADCDLWWGNFKTGPIYHERLPFSCDIDGSVIIAGLPCALNVQENLECLAVDVSGYACVRLGAKTWCLPEKPGEFQFDLEAGDME